MNAIKRKRGFILILVVAMIPLIGTIIAILTANSNILTVRTRHKMLHVKADNACQSGLAWARMHPDEIRTLLPETPLSLLIEEEGPVHILCQIERVFNSVGEPVIRFTGLAENTRISSTCVREAAAHTF